MARSHREPGEFGRAVEHFGQPVRTRVETRKLRDTKRAQVRNHRLKFGGAVAAATVAGFGFHKALDANEAQQHFRTKQNGNTPELVNRQRQRNEATRRFSEERRREQSPTGQGGPLVEGQETIIDRGSETELNGGINSTEPPAPSSKGGGVSSGN